MLASLRWAYRIAICHIEDRVRLFYFKNSKHKNFGDELNTWIWDRLLPGVWDPSDDVYFSSIGSILSQNMMPAEARKWIVFSSGVGYGPRPRNFGSPDWRVLAVRGPVSAHVLGLPASAGVIDGAALLSLLPEYAPLPESERSGIVFMPHFEATFGGHWQEACRLAGFEYLDPFADNKVTLQRLRSAKLVLADAMHAAIVADTFRVPWIPLATSPQINTLKWLDWTLTVGVPYEPIPLPASSLFEGFRSATLGLYGERYSLKPRTLERVVEDYNFRDHRNTKNWWKTYRRNSRRVFESAPLRLVRQPAYRALGSAFDQNCIERAAKALVAASKTRAYLSEDRMFYPQVEELASRLHRVPAAREELAG